MYLIVLSKKYRKSFKKLASSGKQKDIIELEKVVSLIASGRKLSAKFNDHKLHGKLSNCRECHIRPNLLLIYEKDGEKLILTLLDIGSHDDLF